jgi:hypothetical protein
MDIEEITLESSRFWLRGFIRRKTLERLLAAGCLLLAGGALTLLAWSLTFSLGDGLQRWTGHRDWIFVILASLVVLLLFRRASRKDPGDLEGHSVSGGAALDNDATGTAAAISRGLSINPMAPSTVLAFAGMMVDILAFGPRLVLEGIRAIRKCSTLRRIDEEGCAAVLTVLATEGKSLTYSEITQSIDGLDPAVVFPQMPGIDGVIELKRKPPGLSLSGELRDALLATGLRINASSTP